MATKISSDISTHVDITSRKFDSFFPKGTYGYVQKSATADINYQSDLKRIIKQREKY